MYNQQNVQAALSNIQNRQIRESFDRSGFYRAIVVSNDDPLGIGRIKIRIPALHGSNSEQLGYMDDSMLPFAFPGIFQGAGYREGQYMLPSVGHTVWVSFETGTDHYIYFGGLYSIEPEDTKYVYKGRDINNGVPILVAGRDLPNDYDANKHVIYRTTFGDIIYIDDRANRESIVIENRHGNKIKLEKDTVVITSKNPLKADYPYTHVSYCRGDLIGGLLFKIPKSEIFTDIDLATTVQSLYKGSTIVFIDGDKIKGTGLVDYVNDTEASIRLIG